jgi:Na+-transporting NADH:ubiquinone oxidoreductase subunit B
MKKLIESLMHKQAPLFKKGAKLHWAWPLFDGGETFLLRLGNKTEKGAHVRDPMDSKRLMIMVVYALMPAMIFGMWNIGYQAALAEGAESITILDAFIRGAWAMLPIIATSYIAGGIAEVIFCLIRGHEISEGFLVTGLIFPLTLPPTIPLWMVAMSIVFGVVIGKEVFGGVGMNILNPALTARAFAFFTYPSVISGARVWDVADKTAVVDGYTGATPLLTVSSLEPGVDPVQALADAGWTWMDLFLGFVPGSMAEVSAAACLLGALFLLTVGIGSWRVMISCVVGLAAVTFLFNGLAGPESNASMTLPFHYHAVMGGFAYGAIYMATDPVSAAATNRGRLIYGFFIGALAALIRVINPAYPEGMMLAILFMNVFAPLIDYYVVKGTTRRRLARMAQV